MAKDPEDIAPRVLRDIREAISKVQSTLDEHTGRLERLDKRMEDLTRVLRYSMGQNEETAFRQSEQGSRIDELFERLEKLLSSKQPI